MCMVCMYVNHVGMWQEPYQTLYIHCHEHLQHYLRVGITFLIYRQGEAQAKVL